MEDRQRGELQLTSRNNLLDGSTFCRTTATEPHSRGLPAWRTGALGVRAAHFLDPAGSAIRRNPQPKRTNEAPRTRPPELRKTSAS
jgi:hypothetical protein